MFSSLLWHWELLGYVCCRQCQQSQSSTVAGQSVSSWKFPAGVKERMDLPPHLSYFCVQIADRHS